MAKAVLNNDSGSEPDGRPAAQNRKIGQILPAAADLFLESGFEAVTMDMVAQGAGVSKATLYAHFANKKELFAAVITEEARRVNEQIWTPCDTSDDVEQVLKQVARNYFAVFLTERAIAAKKAVFGALPHFPEAGPIILAAGPAKVLAKLTEFIAAASESGRLDVDDPEMAARQFMDLTRGEFDLGSMLGASRPPRAQADATINAAIKMFLARYGKT